MTFMNNVLFLYYPYVALIIFLIGSIYRYETNQYSWKSSSSQILRKDSLFWGSNLFHIGILILLFGHFFGLLTPKIIYNIFFTSETKQLIAMIIGGIAGFLSLIGVVMLIFRRLSDSRIRNTSNPTDIMILFLLFFQLLLGLLSIFVSAQHLDNADVMISLAKWVQGIFIFDSNLPNYVSDIHWIFRIHLFLGMTIFLIFPFTRLVHIFSFPYLYIVRSGYQLTRKNVGKIF